MDHRIFWLLFTCISCEICAISIKCEFEYYALNDQNIFDISTLYYTCVGKIENVDRDKNTTKLLGTNLSANDVEYFLLGGQNLTFFPKDSERFFPNLKIIDLSRNSITEISNAQLRPHQYLTALLMPYNQISKVDSNLFDGLSNLRILDFSYNKVKQVGYDIKLPINGELHFLKNQCVDMEALNAGDIRNLKSVFRSQCLPSEINNLQEKLLQLEISQTILEGKLVNLITESGKENLKKIETEMFSLIYKNIELEQNQELLRGEIRDSVRKVDIFQFAFKVLDNEINHLRNKNDQLETIVLSLKERLDNVENLSHLPGCETKKTLDVQSIMKKTL